MKTGDLTNGQISHLDPHIGQVEKEQSALFHELVSLREVRDRIKAVYESLPDIPAINDILMYGTAPLLSNLEHVVDAITAITDADWDLTHHLEGAIADEYKD
ncbi:MAG: hypothetical protein PVG39_02150 [Desulfobacteraceae bacterium]|jgi:hypothetical protein